MAYRATVVMMLALALVVPALIPAEALAGEGRLEGMARSKLNSIRAQSGARPMKRSRALTRSASAYARFMARNRYFGHLSRIRGPGKFSRLGETILVHPGRAKPRVAIRNWMNSPPHRAILLSNSFRSVGIGRVTGRFGGRRVTFWVAHVGRR
jgi:uncharacterized protein YkwD